MIKKKLQQPHVVVFDLDETLGYFSQFSLIWDSLTNHILRSVKWGHHNMIDFFLTLDIFPEYLRPGIIDVLRYLLEQKSKNIIQKVLIYTNNTGSKDKWLNYIRFYFDYKLQSNKPPLFDDVVAGFCDKNGNRIELRRKHKHKCVSDLVECAKLPPDTRIFFVDDMKHNQMVSSNVVYIKVKPYKRTLHLQDIRFRLATRLPTYRHIVQQYFTSTGKSFAPYTPSPTTSSSSSSLNDMNLIITKGIMIYLQKFIQSKPSVTKSIESSSSSSSESDNDDDDDNDDELFDDNDVNSVSSDKDSVKSYPLFRPKTSSLRKTKKHR